MSKSAIAKYWFQVALEQGWIIKALSKIATTIVDHRGGEAEE